MKKERVYTGYAIVSRDILDDEKYKKGRFGISLHDHNLDSCKRYCRGDQIVVKTYRVLLARFLELRWITKYPCFEKSHRLKNPRHIQLWHLRISWGKDYTDGYERDIVFKRRTAMKASELIRRLAYGIQNHGDLELSFEVIDKDFFTKDICGNFEAGVSYGKNNTICLSIWQYDE